MTGPFSPNTPQYYLWFAYFWADIQTLAGSNPVRVFVPNVPDTRIIYPKLQWELDEVLIPPDFRTFETVLDDGGINVAAIGVLIVCFGQHDTPDDAISAGYAAFAPAVSQQLNDFITNNGIGVPSPQEVQTIADGISSQVKDAIRSHLSDWDKFQTWIGQEVQDEYVGFSYRSIGAGRCFSNPRPSSLQLPWIENKFGFPLCQGGSRETFRSLSHDGPTASSR